MCCTRDYLSVLNFREIATIHHGRSRQQRCLGGCVQGHSVISSGPPVVKRTHTAHHTHTRDEPPPSPVPRRAFDGVSARLVLSGTMLEFCISSEGCHVPADNQPGRFEDCLVGSAAVWLSQARFLACLAVKVARQPGVGFSSEQSPMAPAATDAEFMPARATAWSSRKGVTGVHGPFGDTSRATARGSLEAVVKTALSDMS
jgi:hypothetical protein